MKPKLISQGAEAKIFLDDSVVTKQRIKKGYRHPKLDEQIRKKRTKSEGKILTKALAAGVNVPKVLNANDKGIPRDKFDLEIEYIKGDRLSQTLNDYEEEKQFQVMKLLGAQVAILHKNNIIHGDLTTSNTILRELNSKSQTSGKDKRERAGSSKKFSWNSDFEIFIIDFGLGFISTKIEDKAVDLHLIKQALVAKHYQNHEDLFKEFCKGYSFDDSKKVLERLTIVEKRGRYKH